MYLEKLWEIRFYVQSNTDFLENLHAEHSRMQDLYIHSFDITYSGDSMTVPKPLEISL